MKVSDPTLEEVQRYLLPGLEIMVGAESLVLDGIARGAVGAVSGLAGALPRHVVDAVGAGAGARPSPLGALRSGLERFPFHAAGKLTLIAQQVRIDPSVRAPLRRLTAVERTELKLVAGGVLPAHRHVAGAVTVVPPTKRRAARRDTHDVLPLSGSNMPRDTARVRESRLGAASEPPGSPRPHSRPSGPRIVDVRHRTVSLRAEMANAVISFSTMTASAVAVLSNVIRDGKALVR